MSLLLDHNATIDALYDPQGLSALFVTFISDRVPVVLLLLDRGATVDIRTSYGSTPLVAASKLEFLPIARLLSQRVADMDAATEKYKWAVRRRRRKRSPPSLCERPMRSPAAQSVEADAGCNDWSRLTISVFTGCTGSLREI